MRALLILCLLLLTLGGASAADLELLIVAVLLVGCAGAGARVLEEDRPRRPRLRERHGGRPGPVCRCC